MKRVRIFSLARYVEKALKLAAYAPDEGGMVVAKVPRAAGFFAQGESVEEARANLRDVIEGNVLLALQLGLTIPRIPGFDMRQRTVARVPGKHGKAYTSETQRRGA